MKRYVDFNITYYQKGTVSIEYKGFDLNRKSFPYTSKYRIFCNCDYTKEDMRLYTPSVVYR